jgi:hypothetical protein
MNHAWHCTIVTADVSVLEATVASSRFLLRSTLCGSMMLSGWLAGCVSSSPQPRAAAAPPQAAYNSGAEMYRPNALRQAGSALIFLVGSTVQRLVNFQVVDGMAVLDGDMLLGPASLVPVRFGAPRLSMGGDVKSAVARNGSSALWPRGEIPYSIDPSVPAEKIAWINWAGQHLSQTPLSLRPATSADSDRVVFRDSGPDVGCFSYLGRSGGAQEIQVGGCGARGSVVHEILHAAGFYHEQSRGDRDQFVTVVWNEIDNDHRSNFEMRDEGGVDIDAYDYGSIMHYPSRAFSRTGNQTLIPKNAGVTIGQREGLSALDRSALQRLYGGQGGVPSTTGGGAPGALPFPMPFPMPAGVPGLPGLPFPVPTQPGGQQPAPAQSGGPIPGLPTIPGLPPIPGAAPGQTFPIPPLIFH